jgi:hypothetical protein
LDDHLLPLVDYRTLVATNEVRRNDFRAAFGEKVWPRPAKAPSLSRSGDRIHQRAP